MDYETAIKVFFKPPPAGTPTPYPVVHARPARRLRDACEPLAIHATWCRRTNERLAALGLNFLTGYVKEKLKLLKGESGKVVTHKLTKLACRQREIAVF